jgi:hypothetical protein
VNVIDNFLAAMDRALKADPNASVWVSAFQSHGDCSFEVSCSSTSEKTLWRIVGRHPRYWLIREPSDYFNACLMHDHPLLLRFARPYDLYFSGGRDDAVAVIGELYTRHVAAFGHWLDFHDFVRWNACEILKGGHGLLAQGPREMMDVYAAALAARGIPARILPTHTRDYDYENPSPQLLLIGESYLIAESFEAALVSR